MSFLYSSIEKRRKLFVGIGVSAVVILITAGVFARNDWFPKTDVMSGQRYGWFGKKLPKNAASSWNPLAPPSPTPTLQLSKEYIYAGSRLLAVEDANASAVPPADLAVWRPSTGVWWVLGGPGSQAIAQAWGASTDITVPGDYDGDGKTDFSIFRPSDGGWYVIESGTGNVSITEWGTNGDKPAPADYDGDGKTDRALFREPAAALGQAYFWIMYSSTNATTTLDFGTKYDIPTPADYDGDGRADLSVWRPSDTGFYSITTSNNTFNTVDFTPSGTPVSADYDGDGKADYAVRSGAGWVIRKSSDSTTSTTTPSGDLSTDKPVQNDYDGDGKCDIAVWRPVNSSGQTDVGHWYIRQSATSNSLRDEAWGTSGDIPVPAYYRR